jgi:hypothetical protein
VIEPYVHVIAVLAVCSRLADILTTYLVTPTLKLEANSIARRFGWWYAWLTVLVGFIPYVSPPLGVVVLTTSFMVAAANASKILTARALGEAEMAALSRRVIQATPPWPGLLFMVMPGIFVAILGFTLIYFYPLAVQWGYYFGLGMLVYALAIFVWYPLSYLRVRARLKRL